MLDPNYLGNPVWRQRTLTHLSRLRNNHTDLWREAYCLIFGFAPNAQVLNWQRHTAYVNSPAFAAIGGMQHAQNRFQQYLQQHNPILQLQQQQAQHQQQMQHQQAAQNWANQLQAVQAAQAAQAVAAQNAQQAAQQQHVNDQQQIQQQAGQIQTLQQLLQQVQAQVQQLGAQMRGFLWRYRVAIGILIVTSLLSIYLVRGANPQFVAWPPPSS